MPNTGPEKSGSPIIAVAAGCLVNTRGEVLIAQRPAGKIAAGQWEFPGGKIEADETPRQALVRELHEELGVDVLRARPLIRIIHAYSDRTVALDTWWVSEWSGVLHGRENQEFAWVAPQRLHEYPLLAADRPIVTALRLPHDYAFTAPDATESSVLRRLPSLPNGALLRLRLPHLSRSGYQKLASRVIDAGRHARLQVILDRDPELTRQLGAAGWHASAAELGALDTLDPRIGIKLASCHDAEGLARARALGFDAAVLGPVLPTPTHPQARLLGWRTFAELAGSANLPVYAIGGVGPREQELVFSQYGQGTAGISAYWR
jgi:8-oxo-dGTP diphosphatase